MQRRVSTFKGYTIEATDGSVGSVNDILFEDNTWKLRWFVVNTGSWLLGRKILVHPSSLGRPDIRERAFSVAQPRSLVEASPEVGTDPPVALQMQQIPEDYYAYNPSWIGGIYGDDGLALSTRLGSTQAYGTKPAGDPHLRSLAEVTGYHVHALDGDIGHIEDFLVDDETWALSHAVVDTKNWGFGKHVLITPADIKEVNWSQRYIRVHLTRYQIKCSHSWTDPDWSGHDPG